MASGKTAELTVARLINTDLTSHTQCDRNVTSPLATTCPQAVLAHHQLNMTCLEPVMSVQRSQFSELATIAATDAVFDLTFVVNLAVTDTS